MDDEPQEEALLTEELGSQYRCPITSAPPSLNEKDAVEPSVISGGANLAKFSICSAMNWAISAAEGRLALFGLQHLEIRSATDWGHSSGTLHPRHRTIGQWHQMHRHLASENGDFPMGRVGSGDPEGLPGFLDWKRGAGGRIELSIRVLHSPVTS